MPEANTFAGSALDRASEKRTDASWVAARLADPASRAVLATADGVLVEGARPVLVPLATVADGTEPVLLGVDDRGALFAVDLATPEAAGGGAPDAALRGLREVAMEATAEDAALLAHAVALLNWQRTHRFCANCGALTRSAEAGHVRTCPRCGRLHHPRTDPVVIMLVRDGDRVLLGRQRVWPPGRHSALAGFVEPGESVEEAVVREVREEAGVEVGDVRYRSSQPWPFPASLMLGFDARWVAGEPHARDGELAGVRWFTREEVRRAAEWDAPDAGEQAPLLLPPRLAIARRLIEAWLEETGAG